MTCSLTSVGAETVERFMRIGRMRIENIANVLTDEELETVIKAMRIMSDAVSRQKNRRKNQVATQRRQR